MKSTFGYVLILIGLGVAGFGAYMLWAIFFDLREALAAELYGKPTVITIILILTAVGLGILFGGIKLSKPKT